MDADRCIELFRACRAPVVLTGHENPDGDCVGALLGLRALLQELGVPARIVLPDPLAAALRFLTVVDDGEPVPIEVFDAGRRAPVRAPRADSGGTGDDDGLADRDGLGDCGMLVLVDCSQLSRTGALGAAVAARRTAAAGSAPSVLVIDHHVGGEQGDGDQHFVDVSAAASGEMVARLWDAASKTPPPAAARALFVALVSDTGWFRYSNTDDRVFERARQLTAAGVDVAAVYDQLHRRNHAASVLCLGELIGRSELLADGRVGRLVLSSQQVAEAARVGLELDAAMEPLRSVEGIEVVILIKPAMHGDRVKLSLRAQGDVDVQQVAARFGGGGHRKAAGATFVGQPVGAVVEQVTAAVLEALPAALPEASKGDGPAVPEGGEPR